MACDVRYRTESALVIWILWQFMTQSGTKTEIDPQSPASRSAPAASLARVVQSWPLQGQGFAQ